MSQHLDALAIAEDRRLRIAAIRRRLRSMPSAASRAEAVAILRDPNGLEGRMKGRYLLVSINRFGPARLGKLIRKTGLPAGRLSRPLRELSERERHLIARHLENPDLPAQNPNFTDEELALLGQVCQRLARKMHGEHGDRLRSIALKASQNLAHGMDEQGQQADGHGVPEPHPDRSPVANGRPATPDATPLLPVASGVDLEGVAA